MLYNSIPKAKFCITFLLIYFFGFGNHSKQVEIGYTQKKTDIRYPKLEIIVQFGYIQKYPSSDTKVMRLLLYVLIFRF